jgi:hypothetical protein
MATLTDEQVRVLVEVGLPADRPIRYADLNHPDSPPHALIHDYGHLRRAKEQGFPEGQWLSESIWFPSQIADWLLSLPNKKLTTAVPAKSSTVAPRRKPKPTKAKKTKKLVRR